MTLGCVPVEQSNFPPDSGLVREMLRRRIAGCHAVVRVAGIAYGSEPRTRADGAPRRSYTQLEYEVAVELGKPLYVFVCGDGFQYDQHAVEDQERRSLQAMHRERLVSGDRLYTPVDTRDDLVTKVYALQTRVEALSLELQRSRRRLRIASVASISIAAALSGGLVLSVVRQVKTEERVERLESSIERQRHYVETIATELGGLRARLAEYGLSDDEIYARALEIAALREGVDVREVAAGIELFVAAIDSDPSASLMDRALADFARRRFTEAVALAGDAAEHARERRLAAQSLAQRASSEVAAAAADERRALLLQGQSLVANGEAEEAIGVFADAIAIASPELHGEEWVRLHAEYGEAMLATVEHMDGEAAVQRIGEAIAALETSYAAVEQGIGVSQRSRLQGWLSVAYRFASKVSEPSECRALLERAVALGRESVVALSSDQESILWQVAMNGYASACLELAEITAGPERIAAFDLAADCFRRLAEVCWARQDIANWANARGNLCSAIMNSWRATDGREGPVMLEQMREICAETLAVLEGDEAFAVERASLHIQRGDSFNMQLRTADEQLRDSIGAAAQEAYLAALVDLPREREPMRWATAQSNLGQLAIHAAHRGTDEERKERYEEGIRRYRLALEVFQRDHFPTDWARSMDQIGVALQWLGNLVVREDRTLAMERFAEAIAAQEQARAIRSMEHDPTGWANATSNIARVCYTMATHLQGEEREAAIDRSLELDRESLRVYQPETHGRDWIRANLAMSESLLLANRQELADERIDEAIRRLEAIVERIGADPRADRKLESHYWLAGAYFFKSKRVSAPESIAWMCEADEQIRESLALCPPDSQPIVRGALLGYVCQLRRALVDALDGPARADALRALIDAVRDRMSLLGSDVDLETRSAVQWDLATALYELSDLVGREEQAILLREVERLERELEALAEQKEGEPESDPESEDSGGGDTAATD